MRQSGLFKLCLQMPKLSLWRLVKHAEDLLRLFTIQYVRPRTRHVRAAICIGVCSHSH